MSAGDEARSVAFFGGSFDPPHVAHQMACVYALACAPVDEVWVVPCLGHPLGKELSSWNDRLAMCKLAFRDLARVTVCEVEKELSAPSRTADTLEHLASNHPRTRFHLVVGSDILDEKNRWYRWERIVELADLFVIGRSGWREGDTAVDLPEVSSTQIRERVRKQMSVDSLVDRAVVGYINREGLYMGSRER